jgi:hypothetical protein
MKYVRDLPDEKMKKSGAKSPGAPAAELISKRIEELGDWRGETLSRMRKLIKETDPEVEEERKWRGTPVWSHDGIICTGESEGGEADLRQRRGVEGSEAAVQLESGGECAAGDRHPRRGRS